MRYKISRISSVEDKAMTVPVSEREAREGGREYLGFPVLSNRAPPASLKINSAAAISQLRSCPGVFISIKASRTPAAIRQISTEEHE